MITILNTSIVTDYGNYVYYPISLDEAKNLVVNGFQSAIGHESTAEIISTLLDIKCSVNRITYRQNIGDIALVFKLNSRSEEGKILSLSEIQNIGYCWGVLKRI